MLQRARDLFYAMWIPDLFMKRVEADDQWSLMCPNECPGLHEVWGKEFETLYERCVHHISYLILCMPSLSCLDALLDMSKKGELEGQSKHRSCGLPYWRPRQRRALHTCSIRMPVMGKATSKILEPSNPATSVLR